MPFNEATKREAKERSAFRCCICHKPFVEVHHIVPQSAGGSDFLENAAPLCAYCHDLYGGNPEKRRLIKQMRDSWWQVMERRRDQLATQDLADGVAVIAGDSDNSNLLTRDGIALYHCVYGHETFETAAHMIVTVVAHAQRVRPSFKRHLYLDIEGHRNEKGGYDHDMFELQSHWLCLEFDRCPRSREIAQKRGRLLVAPFA